MDVSGKSIEVAEVTCIKFAFFSCQSNMHPGNFETKSGCKFCFFFLFFDKQKVVTDGNVRIRNKFIHKWHCSMWMV